MNKDVDIRDLIKIKSDIICYGIKSNEISDKIYDIEHKTKVKRTSNMGLQLLLSEDIIVSVPYDRKNNFNSKYYLYEASQKLYLTNDKITIEVRPFPYESPAWYDYKLENGNYISDYIQKEGRDVLICSITQSCCYFSKSEECAFCALNGKETINDPNRVKCIIESLKYILQEDQTVKSINLTGGNLYTKDRGANQYINILKEIRRVSNIPIVVEISPPEDLSILDDIYLSGATAIEMNIEIWDEKIRKMMMPGKAKIKREYYIEAWKKAVNIFGKGNVGSAIIVGLENSSSSLEGIREMINVGCLPSIIPFKPSNGAILEKFRNCSSKEIIYVTTEAAKMLKSKQLSPINGLGCIGCGACTLESDMYRL